MKLPFLVLFLAGSITVILKAVDETAAPAPAGSAEAPAAQPPPKPSGPGIVVVGVSATAQGKPRIDPMNHESWKAERTRLEAELNRLREQGYSVAGMNDDWIVMERRPVSSPNRRVVLPTQ